MKICLLILFLTSLLEEEEEEEKKDAIAHCTCLSTVECWGNVPLIMYGRQVRKKKEREEICLTCWHGSGTHDWWDISLTWTKQASRLQFWKLLSGEATGNGGVAVLVTMMCNVSPTNQRMEWKASDRTGLLLCVCVEPRLLYLSIFTNIFFLLPPTVCTIFLTTIIFFASASYWSFWPFFLNKKGVLVTIGPPEMGGRRTDQNFW